MDGSASQPGNTTRVRLVKAAVNLYGNRIADVNSPSLKKDCSTKHSSKAKELQRARRDIVRYKESREAAESAKAQAETELSNANKTVKDLFSMIGESSYKAKAQKRDMASLKKFGKSSKNDNNEYSQVMRELECAKRELFQLKLDVASVLEEKLRAEKEIEASRSNTVSCSRVAQTLRKEIEDANEEQVVVELARMDALKEVRDIEALENTRNKLKEAIREIQESEELEMKLATTLSDIDILKHELMLVKKMEKRVERDVPVLETIKEEIEAAKKELASIREKGFKFMTSMDVTRNELKHVNAVTVYITNTESKIGAKVRNLSYKLLRAKSKLEAVSAAEDKAKSIAINLSQTLNKLRSQKEAAKKEKELINEEVAATKEEIKKALLEIEVSEERLQGAIMQELEACKSSEALALEKLKFLRENPMRERSLNTQPSSLITISKFEYEYLTNHAAEANEIADKKVEAAKAWVEAVRSSEKETVMKTKIAEAKLEVYAKEKLVSKRVGNEELENWSRKREKNPPRELQRAFSRKSMKSDGSMTPSRGSKFQKSASPRPVSPFIVKKKKKVIPNWTKFFRGKRNTSTL
ncbi:PLASTID MOVEMENT IMPAIRED 2 [Spatholobus suberectus]|nr:PLASTID MOVEMENT IMPAIRED 2 [Spatholobus suberectus]